jgi:hypothetical protein
VRPIRKACACLAGSLLAPPSGMTTSLTGTWHTQHLSVLHLIEEAGRLTGTFTPGVGPLRGSTFALQGVRLGDQVAFMVAFEKTSSVTTWVGHIRGDGAIDQLDMLWEMAVRHEPGARDESWRGIWTGSDTINRGEPGLVVVDRRRPSVPV